MDKYERNTNPHCVHSIKSSEILCCAETGRVIATFYHEYDLEAAIKKLNNHDKLVEALRYISSLDECGIKWAASRATDVLKEIDQ